MGAPFVSAGEPPRGGLVTVAVGFTQLAASTSKSATASSRQRKKSCREDTAAESVVMPSERCRCS